MRGTQFFLPLVEAVSVTDLSYLIALKLSRACIRYVLFCVNKDYTNLTLDEKTVCGFDSYETFGINMKFSAHYLIYLSRYPKNLKHLMLGQKKGTTAGNGISVPMLLPDTLESLYMIRTFFEFSQLPKGLRKYVLCHKDAFKICHKELPKCIEHVEIYGDDNNFKTHPLTTYVYPNLKWLRIEPDDNKTKQFNAMIVRTSRYPKIRYVEGNPLDIINDEDLQFLGSDSNKNDSVVYKFKKRRMN